MNRLILAVALLIGFSITAQTSVNAYSALDIEYADLDTEKRELEKKIFKNIIGFKGEVLEVEDIFVVEIEEEVELNFDKKQLHSQKRSSCKKEKAIHF